ncbi:multicopper oxidase family protein [Sulfitobacter sp. SK012]|uniref:multicopper oxidase family protein n=1 Tax=Sulfitobacter sp. SK012 TaxID=1389005 RepID=UPI0020C7946E|nr:multicopper oxidase family protein [Sulfitobacter sp. SK012]
MTSYAFGEVVTRGLVRSEDNALPRVLRLRQGKPAIIDYTNGLEDYSTMHWHGIRLPNAMDGFPYLTQFPIGQNETFRYEFTPPDAGTYWYHPHCMTMSQMALGLTGILIVEEADDLSFDADIPLNLKDFRLTEDRSVLPYFTARGAWRYLRQCTNSKLATVACLRCARWRTDPIALRGTDTTRVHKLVFPDVPGQIIAWDGHPIEEAILWPTIEAPLLLGPGQRVDVAFVAPAREGQEVVFTGLLGRTPFVVAKMRAIGQDLQRAKDDLQPLPRNSFEKPDIEAAIIQEIVVGRTPKGDGTNNGLCGTFDYIFWSINRNPWPGDAVEGTGPVLTMHQGQSYILRMRNESPNLHPIHLHGLVFKPIRSNLRHIPAYFTDTLLLLKDEIVDIAVLADNPGDWAFHCHVIEHQKTGLSGYIRVV